MGDNFFPRFNALKRCRDILASGYYTDPEVLEDRILSQLSRKNGFSFWEGVAYLKLAEKFGHKAAIESGLRRLGRQYGFPCDLPIYDRKRGM